MEVLFSVVKGKVNVGGFVAIDYNWIQLLPVLLSLSLHYTLSVVMCSKCRHLLDTYWVTSYGEWRLLVMISFSSVVLYCINTRELQT